MVLARKLNKRKIRFVTYGFQDLPLSSITVPCPFFGVAYRETIILLISLLQLIFIMTRTGNSMEKIYIKAPNRKCRLYWRYSQLCWFFRPAL